MEAKVIKETHVVHEQIKAFWGSVAPLSSEDAAAQLSFTKLNR